MPDTLQTHKGNQSSDYERGSMARFRYQKGYVFLRGTVWYGKYREDVVGKDGLVRRVQRRTPLGTKVQYPTKRLAERRLEQILSRINDPMYRPDSNGFNTARSGRWVPNVIFFPPCFFPFSNGEE
jgi:hypothetical protein